MKPEIEKAVALGVTAIVECSTGGVGVRPDIDKAVSLATSFPLVVPTGFYREPWIPQWVHEASTEELILFMSAALEEEIPKTGVQAAWIKLSAGNEGITGCETKVLIAAAKAASKVNAVIGSHTIKGRVVHEQLDIIEDNGYSPERFIWIHTQAESDFNLHLEIAERGAWLEYDEIGNDPADDELYIANIKRLLDAEYGDQLLLSHDRGWYDPAKPRGGIPKPFTYISEHFLPKLRESGFDEETITQMICINPFKAFAR
jgi:phosphotriesterase-related protein